LQRKNPLQCHVGRAGTLHGNLATADARQKFSRYKSLGNYSRSSADGAFREHENVKD
jgi:hypothetical protein